MPRTTAPTRATDPRRVASNYNHTVEHNDGYDDALTELRDEIRGLAGLYPQPLAGLIEAFFAEREVDVAATLAESGDGDALEGLEALAVEHSDGPEEEGEVLLELYEHLYNLLPETA